MQESLNLLMELKMKHNPAPNNHYLFPARDSKKHLRGDTVLRIFTLRAGLAEPRNITRTKYLATTCQLRNMLNNEFDWLARHMGYDILVHRNYYRLQQDAVELAKISKVLLLIEKGETHKVAGRSLDERDINGKFIQYYFHIFSYTLVKFTKHHEK